VESLDDSFGRIDNTHQNLVGFERHRGIGNSNVNRINLRHRRLISHHIPLPLSFLSFQPHTKTIFLRSFAVIAAICAQGYALPSSRATDSAALATIDVSDPPSLETYPTFGRGPLIEEAPAGVNISLLYTSKSLVPRKQVRRPPDTDTDTGAIGNYKHNRLIIFTHSNCQIDAPSAMYSLFAGSQGCLQVRDRGSIMHVAWEGRGYIL